MLLHAIHLAGVGLLVFFESYLMVKLCLCIARFLSCPRGHGSAHMLYDTLHVPEGEVLLGHCLFYYYYYYYYVHLAVRFCLHMARVSPEWRYFMITVNSFVVLNGAVMVVVLHLFVILVYVFKI